LARDYEPSVTIPAASSAQVGAIVDLGNVTTVSLANQISEMDVWEEEYEQRLAEYEDAALAADPEEHRFDVPEGCFWKDVRKESVDIGTILNTSFRAIEDANPRLKGVSVILPRSTSSSAWIQRRGRMGQLVPTLRMSGMPPSVGT
jgi:hypothetical protein